MGLFEDKKTMRSALTVRRAQVEPGARARWSAALGTGLTASAAWARAGSVAAFVGVGDEPDTTLVLEAALAGAKRLWLPRVASETELEFAEVADLGALVRARFGLLEPPVAAPGRALADTGVDLVVVPGLAFGTDGARIGYGRGYYDRALAGFRASRPPCIGVCFASFLDPVEGPIPTGPHDQRVDGVITERGLVECRRQPDLS